MVSKLSIQKSKLIGEVGNAISPHLKGELMTAKTKYKFFRDTKRNNRTSKGLGLKKDEKETEAERKRRLKKEQEYLDSLE